MPYSDPEKQRKAQLEYHYRKKERIARGEIPKPTKNSKPPPRPITIPKSLRHAHPLVLNARANFEAWERYQEKLIVKPSWQMTTRDETKNSQALTKAHPYVDAPRLDVSETQLKRALRILNAVLKELERPRRKIELVTLEYPIEVEEPIPTIRFRFRHEVFDLALYEEHKRERQPAKVRRYPWETHEWTNTPTGVLAIRVGERRYRDTRTKTLEQRLGYLFRELPEQVADRKQAERDRIKWERDAPKREEERRQQEARERRERELKEEQDRQRQIDAAKRERQQQAEREQQQRERKRIKDLDNKFESLIAGYDLALMIEPMIPILKHRVDKDAAQWHAFAQQYLTQLDPRQQSPTRPQLSAPPTITVSLEDIDLVPEPTGAIPECPTTFRGSHKLIKQLRENDKAQQAHRRYEHRNRWYRYSSSPKYWNEYHDGKLALGTEKPHESLPDLDVASSHMRDALLILNAIITPASKMGYDIDTRYDFNSHRNALQICLGQYKIPVEIRHARQRSKSPALILNIGHERFAYHNFEDMQPHYDELIQLPQQLAHEQREQKRQDQEKWLQNEATDEFQEQARLREQLERYRRKKLTKLAAHLHLATLHEQLKNDQNTVRDRIPEHERSWLERKDPRRETFKLPEFTPDELEDHSPEDEDEPTTNWPREVQLEPYNYWNHRHWWNRH